MCPNHPAYRAISHVPWRDPVIIRPLHMDLCRQDGRGPELLRVHYDGRGVRPVAIDYADKDGGGVRNVLLRKAQVFKFTPEEVDGDTLIRWSETKGAAIVCLGRSLWLRSFNPLHLDRCQHFRVMFYDEFLDVVCEGLDVQPGPYL